MTSATPLEPALPPRRHPVLRTLAVLGLLAGLLVGSVAALGLASPDDDALELGVSSEPVEEAVDPLLDPDGPGYERQLAVVADGDALRAEHDEALAAAAAMAEAEAAAAAQAEAEAAAQEQAALEAAAAEEAAEAAAAAEVEAEAEAPPPEPPPAPTNPPPPAPVEGDPFDALAQCESGRNPNAYNPAGPYYGAFQFHQSTWNAYAPDMPGKPTDYGYAQQKTVAQRLQAARGWSPWPHCARQLGLL